MTKRALATATAQAIEFNGEDKKTLIEEYKELEVECDRVLEKITKRKTRKTKKSA